jgi:hypothetical protein
MKGGGGRSESWRDLDGREKNREHECETTEEDELQGEGKKKKEVM